MAEIREHPWINAKEFDVDGVKESEHNAVPLLHGPGRRGSLPSSLSGAIQLVRADFMKQSTQPHLLRRQGFLEALERDKQIARLPQTGRGGRPPPISTTAASPLSHTAGSPDHSGRDRRVSRGDAPVLNRFLNHQRRAWAAVLGFRRAPAEATDRCRRRRSLTRRSVAWATCTRRRWARRPRLRTIPKRPARLDAGELVVLVDGGDVVTAEREAALTAELAMHGRSKACAASRGGCACASRRTRRRRRRRRAAAAAAVAGAVAVFPFWNARARWPSFPSGTRGTTKIEAGRVSKAACGEAIAQAQHYKGLDSVLDRLPPKIIEIDGDEPRLDADEVGGDEGRGTVSPSACAPRSRRQNSPARGMIRWWWGCTTITVAKISNAMRLGREEGKVEGRGTLRYADGKVAVSFSRGRGSGLVGGRPGRWRCAIKRHSSAEKVSLFGRRDRGRGGAQVSRCPMLFFCSIGATQQ